jgi:hypothetical protein
MEREQEIRKLVNVLRQTSRTANQAVMTGGNGDAAAHCIEQYNRVLTRLTAIDPEVGALFAPLGPATSLTVVAMACRQLAAYYADEVGAGAWPGGGWPGVPGAAFDPEAFKDFWRKSAGEIEDFGEFIRENLNTWFGDVRRRTEARKGEGKKGNGEAPEAQ